MKVSLAAAVWRGVPAAVAAADPCPGVLQGLAGAVALDEGGIWVGVEGGSGLLPRLLVCDP